MNTLTLRYRFDDADDLGWLELAVASEGFCGRGGFWVQWQEIRDFGEALATYPILPDAPLKAEWGFEMLEGDDLRLSVEICPANPTGDLGVEVVVADYKQPRQRVRTSFRTNYPDIEAFRIGIAKLMDRQAHEAILLGR